MKHTHGSQSWGHENVKNGSLFAFFAYDSKNYSLVWVKYLTPPKILYWVLSENGIVNGFWSYRSWDNEVREM